ncbi:MAG: hypothetical protein IM592_05580 [Bacteroidetes bacterium]|nr:hypothetical protein [Bacteroidota bacterium]
MSTFIILSPETLKMRSLDLMFYSIFLFLQPLLFKYNNSIKLITNLTLGIILSLTSLFAYKYISSYILSSFFSEKTNREITSTKQEFYFIDKDSANTTFPFLKKNKIYFIEFWNKSCGICVKNLPEIKRLQSTYKNDTVVEIISLYCPINQNETRDWFYNIFLTNNIKLPDIKYSYTSIGMNLKYKITTFPHFFLIDKEGNGIEGSQVYFDKSLPNNIYDKIEDLKKK